MTISTSPSSKEANRTNSLSNNGGSGFEIPPIRYDVPEPTSYTGAHIIRLELPVHYFSKQMAPDYALEFADSRLSYVNLDFQSGTFTEGLTMEVWLKRHEQSTGTPNLGMGLSLDEQGRLTYNTGSYQSGGRFEIASEVLKPGEWHHVAITILASSKAVTLFLDGKAIGSVTNPRLNLPDQRLTFGGREAGGYLDGLVDEFRLWNVARSEEEIQTNRSNTVIGQSGLVCHWRFNDGKGDTIKDHSGNGHDGKAHNIRWVVSDRPLSEGAVSQLDLTAGKLKEIHALAKEQGIFNPEYFPALSWIKSQTERQAASDAFPEEGVFIKNYQTGLTLSFYRTISGQLAPRFIDLNRGEHQPAIYLIERYRLSSFLGAYGAGRTISTFSLLPGEKTTISISSYRSTEKKSISASSILDSYTTESANEFETSLNSESSSASSRKDSSSSKHDQSFRVDSGGSMEAGWGFGSAEFHVDMGMTDNRSYGTDTESSREEFAKNVSNATSKHAAMASSKREVSITANTEETEQRGSSQQVVREIQNVNTSRTLNFIFRQMNQEFYTFLHLIDVRVAASGFPAVTLPELDTLLNNTLTEDVRLKVKQRIEAELSQIRDYRGEVRAEFLKKRELKISAENSEYHMAINRDFTSRYVDPLTDQTFELPGIIINVDKITMRTDGVMVEAILGQGVALDEDALKIQQAKAKAMELDNQIKATRLKILQYGDETRANLYARLFPSDSQE